MIQNKLQKRNRIGPVAQKVLLLLAAGAALSLTKRPDYYFRILKTTKKEWQRINQRSLRKTICNLYQSNLITCKDNPDGTTTLILAKNGKKQILKYKIDDLKIKKPLKWDGLWRIVIFDIPEYKKAARDALSSKLKEMGMVPIQKSVFATPYDCKNEIDFVSEIFEVKPFVRFMVVKEIDIALDLKRKFYLI